MYSALSEAVGKSSECFYEKRERYLESMQIASRLSCTVILQVAKDLTSEINDSPKSLSAKKEMKRRIQAKRDAFSWIKNKNKKGFFSLENCCEHINNYLTLIGRHHKPLTPKCLREKLLVSPQDVVSLSHHLCSMPFSPSTEKSLDRNVCLFSLN